MSIDLSHDLERDKSPGSGQAVVLHEALKSPRAHDHLCIVYETTEEWRDAVIPFLVIGLKRGEKCLCLVDTSAFDAIRSQLEQQGIDASAAESRGQLAIVSKTHSHTREGSCDPDGMIAILIAEAEKALGEGYRGMRVTSEMTWALRGCRSSEKLLEYEARLNSEVFARYPVIALCQYDRRKFEPEVIKGAIMTHPLLISRGRVHRNFYYVAPDQLLSHERAEREVEYWLNNLEREHETEERYRVLFESANDAILLIKEGQFVDCNQKALEMFGCPRHEIIGRPPDAFSPPYQYDGGSSAEEARRHIAAAAAGGARTFDWQHCRRDGTLFDAEVSLANLTVGGEALVLGIVRDVTGRKRAEESARHNEDLLCALLDNVPDLIYFKDTESRFIRVNQAWIDLVGAESAEAVVGKTDLDVFPPDLAAQMYADERRLVESGEPVVGHVERHVNSDGAVRYLRATKVPVKDADGHVTMIVGITSDLTSERQTEEALRNSEERYRALAESTPDAIFVIDHDGRMEYINNAAAGQFGRAPEQIVGMHLDELFPENVAETSCGLDATGVRIGPAPRGRA